MSDSSIVWSAVVVVVVRRQCTSRGGTLAIVGFGATWPFCCMDGEAKRWRRTTPARGRYRNMKFAGDFRERSTTSESFTLVDCR